MKSKVSKNVNIHVDWDFPFFSLGFCTPSEEVELSTDQLPLNRLFSKFMVLSVKSDSSIILRYCKFKCISLLDTDVDDSITVQLYGFSDIDKRWHPIDLFYDCSKIK